MVDDAKLIAYIAGGLDARNRAEVEAALAVDPLLATRLARHRDLQARGASADAPMGMEAVSERRRAAGGATSRPANIVRLADRRNPSRAKLARPFKWPSWSPIAASLALGVVGGYGLSHQGAGSLAVRADGALAARGDLAKALDRDATGGTGPIRIGLSFRSAERYCRAFQVEAQRLAGVACKTGPAWIASMTTVTPPGSARLRRTAAPLPPAVLTAVGQLMVGRSLGRTEEDAARARGWRI